MDKIQRPDLPALDDLIPPFKRRPREEELSSRRQAEKDVVDARRSQLIDLLEELNRLRQFFDGTTSNHEWLEARLQELQESARLAEQEHQTALRKAESQRYAEIAFLLQAVFAAGQLGALSQDSGKVTSGVTPGDVTVKLVFDRVEFAMRSGNPTRLEIHGDVLSQPAELRDTGLDPLQLFGLARIFGWKGVLPQQEVRDLSEANVPPSQVASVPAPDPLRQFLQDAGEAGFSIHLQK